MTVKRKMAPSPHRQNYSFKEALCLYFSGGSHSSWPFRTGQSGKFRQAARMSKLILVLFPFMLLHTTMVDLSWGKGKNPSHSAEFSLDTIRGVVKPTMSAMISSEIQARIIKLPFKDGQRFERGNILVEFDCAKYVAELSAVRAQYDVQQKILENNMELAKLQAIGQLEIDIARANTKKAHAAVRIAQVSVNGCRVTAPFSGRVVRTMVNPYESVNPYDELIHILDDTQLEIELILPSKSLRWLTKDTEFDFLIDETNLTYPARVLEIGASIEPVSQTVRVLGEFSSDFQNVISGMSGSATFSKKAVRKAKKRAGTKAAVEPAKATKANGKRVMKPAGHTLKKAKGAAGKNGTVGSSKATKANGKSGKNPAASTGKKATGTAGKNGALERAKGTTANGKGVTQPTGRLLKKAKGAMEKKKAVVPSKANGKRVMKPAGHTLKKAKGAAGKNGTVGSSKATKANGKSGKNPAASTGKKATGTAGKNGALERAKGTTANGKGVTKPTGELLKKAKGATGTKAIVEPSKANGKGVKLPPGHTLKKKVKGAARKNRTVGQPKGLTAKEAKARDDNLQDWLDKTLIWK